MKTKENIELNSHTEAHNMCVFMHTFLFVYSLYFQIKIGSIFDHVIATMLENFLKLSANLHTHYGRVR